MRVYYCIEYTGNRAIDCGLDLSGSGLGPFTVSCENGYGFSDPIKCRGFLD